MKQDRSRDANQRSQEKWVEEVKQRNFSCKELRRGKQNRPGNGADYSPISLFTLSRSRSIGNGLRM